MRKSRQITFMWQFSAVLIIHADVCGKRDVYKRQEWYDQRATFQVNREKAHTSFTSFQTVEDAKVRDKSNSPFYQLLSGQWKFEFAENPAGRNTEFYKNDYDVSNWDDIAVPANWQTEGYDHPKYTCLLYTSIRR